MTLERIIIENRRKLPAGAPEHRVDVGSAPTYIEEQGQGGKSPLLILSTHGIFQIFFAFERNASILEACISEK